MSTNETINKIIEEQAITHKERLEVIRGSWVALVGKQHFLMLGPGGTGKSMFTRDVANRILHPDNGQPLWDEYAATPTFNGYFEKALDESSTPDEVFGPPDIKGMVEQGKTRRVVDGMLPEAFISFLDEFFNANGVTLHSTMPVLNERFFHNNGVPMRIPLWTAFLATNKLNSDADQAALWDRVHHRQVVSFVQDRVNKQALVEAAIKRNVSTYTPPTKTTVSLTEIQAAHDEAMQIPVSEDVYELFFDIHDALRAEGITVGDRRIVQGMTAILANAYINGHDEVKSGDLDVLANMWWVLQDQMDAARKVVLEATNPGEKKALDMLDDLDKMRADINEVRDADQTRKSGVGLEVFRNCQKLSTEAKDLLDRSEATGASTTRIKELIKRCDNLMQEVSKDIFGIDSDMVGKLQGMK